MKHDQLTPQPAEGSVVSYTAGYVLSLLLTFASYMLVRRHLLSRNMLIGEIIGLAVLQLLVQLRFFLHLGREKSPRWKLAVFGFMLMIVGILVIGSLWIMKNLNYHQMTPEQENTYIHSQDGL